MCIFNGRMVENNCVPWASGVTECAAKVKETSTVLARKMLPRSEFQNPISTCRPRGILDSESGKDNYVLLKPPCSLSLAVPCTAHEAHRRNQSRKSSLCWIFRLFIWCTGAILLSLGMKYVFRGIHRIKRFCSNILLQSWNCAVWGEGWSRRNVSEFS